MWKRKELKQKGKAAFMANYWKCVLVGILMSMFVAGASVSTGRTVRSGVNTNDSDISVISDGSGNTYFIDNKTGEQKGVLSDDELQSIAQDPEFLTFVGGVIAGIGVLLFVVAFICTCLRLLIFNPIEVGCRGFFLSNTVAPAGLDELKAGFNSYGRNVCSMFLRDLFLFLFSPGVMEEFGKLRCLRIVISVLIDERAQIVPSVP